MVHLCAGVSGSDDRVIAKFLEAAEIRIKSHEMNDQEVFRDRVVVRGILLDALERIRTCLGRNQFVELLPQCGGERRAGHPCLYPVELD